MGSIKKTVSIILMMKQTSLANHTKQNEDKENKTARIRAKP